MEHNSFRGTHFQVARTTFVAGFARIRRQGGWFRTPPPSAAAAPSSGRPAATRARSGLRPAGARARAASAERTNYRLQGRCALGHRPLGAVPPAFVVARPRGGRAATRRSRRSRRTRRSALKTGAASRPPRPRRARRARRASKLSPSGSTPSATREASEIATAGARAATAPPFCAFYLDSSFFVAPPPPRCFAAGCRQLRTASPRGGDAQPTVSLTGAGRRTRPVTSPCDEPL